MSDSDPPAPGLFGSLRNLLDTVLETLQNRIELLGVEWQEERRRLVGLIVTAGLCLVLGIVGAIALTAAIVLAFPTPWRVYVTAAFGLAYVGAAVVVFLRLRRRLRHSPSPFSESLGQIKKDREWLRQQL